jgi:hypothetical protein
MDILNPFVSVIGLIVTGVGSLYTYLTYRGHKTAQAKSLTDEKVLPVDIPDKLLSLIWHYPENGGNCVSWAVKESYVLRGWLKKAREEPGLGVAIVTTELALNIFGENANSRIDGCITWAIANSFSEPPFFLKGKRSDTRDSEEEVVPDFRHTLAFSIILARTGKLKERVNEFLQYTLNHQNADGGWSAGQGKTVSEVFTVLYAIEFLSVCALDDQITETKRSIVQASRDHAMDWLILKVSGNGMWESGVFKDYVWDDLFTTAWVLYRLSQLKDIISSKWNEVLLRSSLLMISKVSKPTTWERSPQLQHFRLEARVAAALAVYQSTGLLDSNGSESLLIYLSDWRRRAELFARKISDDDWDVATAAFYLQAMFSLNDIKGRINKIGLIIS